MKCVRCDEEAEYVVMGTSVCKKHRESFLEDLLEGVRTLKSLFGSSPSKKEPIVLEE